MEEQKAHSENTVMRRYQPLALYALVMAGMGVWQLLDWYYGTEDPIWHLLFYIFLMPLCSLAYGITAGAHKRPWLVPPVAGGTCALVYICMANGGFSVDSDALSGALELSVPSFITAAAGVIICRITLWISRSTRHK